MLTKRLEGKTAIITGGGSGIGLAAARLFAAEGARIAVLGRDRAKLDAASGFAVVADIGRPDELAAAMKEVNDRLGAIDILFANAGVSETPPFAETTESVFDAFMNINVKGTVFSVLHALPFLRDRASIILTGSVAARKGWPGDPVYAASKGAVRSFGRALAVEDGILARKIRVNVLTPGAIATPLTREATEQVAIREFVEERIPMKRWGEASEVAEAALFLASDASSYMTGGEITVDGGLAHV